MYKGIECNLSAWFCDDDKSKRGKVNFLSKFVFSVILLISMPVMVQAYPRKAVANVTMRDSSVLKEVHILLPGGTDNYLKIETNGKMSKVSAKDIDRFVAWNPEKPEQKYLFASTQIDLTFISHDKASAEKFYFLIFDTKAQHASIWRKAGVCRWDKKGDLVLEYIDISPMLWKKSDAMPTEIYYNPQRKKNTLEYLAKFFADDKILSEQLRTKEKEFFKSNEYKRIPFFSPFRISFEWRDYYDYEYIISQYVPNR